MVQIVLRIALLSALSILYKASAGAQTHACVTLSEKTRHGFLSIFYGVDFSMRNTSSGVIYRSVPLNALISRHSLIDSLPQGEYDVIYVGSHQVARVDTAVQNFFGMIKVEAGRTYYLGDFEGYIPIGRNMLWTLTIKNETAPKRLCKVLRRRNLLRNDNYIINLAPYLRDSLTVIPID